MSKTFFSSSFVLEPASQYKGKTHLELKGEAGFSTLDLTVGRFGKVPSPPGLKIERHICRRAGPEGALTRLNPKMLVLEREGECLQGLAQVFVLFCNQSQVSGVTFLLLSLEGGEGMEMRFSYFENYNEI